MRAGHFVERSENWGRLPKMSIEPILVLAILFGAVALFISEKYPIDFVALLVLGTLLGLGLVTPEEGRHWW